MWTDGTIARAEAIITSEKKVMSYTTEQNKAIVIRFNKECIEAGRQQSIDNILSADVINHSAQPGMPNGVESFSAFLLGVLHTGFSSLKVDILDQIAERDLVATRKRITGIHTGNIFGIKASGKPVAINVIDIIRLKEGKYAEHWGQSNFGDVMKDISESSF